MSEPGDLTVVGDETDTGRGQCHAGRGAVRNADRHVTLRHESSVTRADYAARIVRGGLPEATSRDDARRRQRFLNAYVQALIDRDVHQLSDIQHKGEPRRLVRLLAARSATIIAANSLEPALGLSRPTIARYLQLSRQLTWSQQSADLSHYRDHSKFEVDAVLENRAGQVVGIEAKAASTVGPDDFRGLRRLADRLGDDFIAGIVLYTGTTTLPFGAKLRAMPVSALWQAPTPE